MSPGVKHIDVEGHDDLELGDVVRAAYRDGIRVIVLLPLLDPSSMKHEPDDPPRAA